MKPHEGRKALRDDGGCLGRAERSVYLLLLLCADNEDCAVPAIYAPSVPEIARITGLHRSTVPDALLHLETHGWVVRAYHKGGRGRRNSYQLEHGRSCPSRECPHTLQNQRKPPARVPETVVSTRPFEPERAVSTRPVKGRVAPPVSAGQNGLAPKRQQGGGVDEESLARAYDSEAQSDRPAVDAPDEGAEVWPVGVRPMGSPAEADRWRRVDEAIQAHRARRRASYQEGTDHGW